MYDAVATGRRIRRVRRSRKMTQKELGRRTGVSDRHISTLENGKENPGFDLLIRLCDVLEVTPDYLLLGSTRGNTCDGISQRLRLCGPGQQQLVKMMIELMLRVPVWPAAGTMQVETPEGFRCVNKQDIVFVETSHRGVCIHTTKGCYETFQTMGFWEQILSDPQFFRTHQSYIVNFFYVSSYDSGLIMFRDCREKAYMARRRYAGFCRAYACWLENGKEKKKGL